MISKVTKPNFEGQVIYVGIDVHKKQWKVSIGLNTSCLRTFSQPADTMVLYNHLQRNYPGARYECAYEASYCGFWIQEQLHALGLSCLVVNPSDIPTTDKDRKQKNDKRDSRKLLKGLQANQLEGIYIPDKAQQEDRSLVRQREAIIKASRRVKNQIKSKLLFYGVAIPPSFQGACWSNRFISWLKECEQLSPLDRSGLNFQIEHLEFLRSLNLKITRQIRALSKTQGYAKQVRLLTSIPGIAMLTAMKYLTAMGPINRFNNLDQHAAFIGLIPNTYSSGENQRSGSMTKRATKIVKTALIESAWTAKRLDPALALKYEQLTKRMKPSKAIVIIAKKLLSRIRFVLNNEQLYQNSIVHKQANNGQL